MVCRSVRLIELFNESPQSLSVFDDMFNELSSQFVAVAVVDFRDGIIFFVGDGDRGGLVCNSLLLSGLFIYEHTNKLSLSLKIIDDLLPSVVVCCGDILATLFL